MLYRTSPVVHPRHSCCRPHTWHVLCPVRTACGGLCWQIHRMLRIHAVFDRQLGYVQGMSYHAAVLALVASCGGFEALPDNTPAVGDVVGGEALCRMFTSLLAPRQNGPLRQLLSFDMGLWDAHCRVFDRLLFLDQPDLQQTLRRRHVTVNLFMYPWFQVRGWTACALVP